MSYRLPRFTSGTVMVVGCGGTGGFVAEGLCRLFVKDRKRRIMLIDPDRVEERNLGRQNFTRADLGKFKAQALAERLANEFRREVEYYCSPVELMPRDWGNLTIGCVDNPSARERLQICATGMMGQVFTYNYFDGWLIDAGNSEYSGQVLIGNSFVKQMANSFRVNAGVCDRLPLPGVQQPGLLAPESKPRRRRDCAAAVEAEEQSPVINQAMASLVLTFVHRLLEGKLEWMGAYIDLEKGTLAPVPITPEAVGRITGHSVKQLEYRPRARE